jgi:hypothetical protein
MTTSAILMLMAVMCFLLASFRVALPFIDLVPLGLFFLAVVVLINRVGMPL